MKQFWIEDPIACILFFGGVLVFVVFAAVEVYRMGGAAC